MEQRGTTISGTVKTLPRLHSRPLDCSSGDLEIGGMALLKRSSQAFSTFVFILGALAVVGSLVSCSKAKDESTVAPTPSGTVSGSPGVAAGGNPGTTTAGSPGTANGGSTAESPGNESASNPGDQKK